MAKVLDFDAIDVSSWQGEINWGQVKTDGVQNAYIRSTIGTAGLDARFNENASHCTIPHSYYHLFKGHLDGVQQAHYFLNTISDWSDHLPPALDVEPVSDDTSTPAQRTENLRRMVEKIRELTGEYPVIYTGGVWNSLTIPQYDSLFSQCRLWIAQYNDAAAPSPLPRGWSDWWLWQYTSDGVVDGIEGRLDFSRWTDDGGVRHVRPIVAASNLRLLGSKRDSQGGGGPSDFPSEN